MKRKKRTVREKLERHRRRRLLREAKKLNPKEERALAEELHKLAEGYRAMAEEDRETAERRVSAFREILK